MKGLPYLGAIGRTRTAIMHITDPGNPGGPLIAAAVYTSIDVIADPALADRLRRNALNVVRLGDRSLRIAVPVLYHDPAAALLVLVLDDAHRHRELDERIRVLEQLRDDPAAVPAYAKNFAVVFGAAGLRAHLTHGAKPSGGVALVFHAEPENDELAHVAKAASADELAHGSKAASGDELAHGAKAARGGELAHDVEPASSGELAHGAKAARGGELAHDVEPASSGEPARRLSEAASGAGRPGEAASGAGRPGEAASEAAPDLASASGRGAAREDRTLDAEDSIEAESREDRTLDAEDSVEAESEIDGDPVGADDESSAAADAGDAIVELALDAGPTFDDQPTPGAKPAIRPAVAIEARRFDTDPAASEGDLDFDGDTALESPAAIEARASRATDPTGLLGPGIDPLTTEVTDLAVDAGDAEPASARDAGWRIDDDRVHLGIAVDAPIPDELAGLLDIRLVLHRTPSASVIALVVGAPLSLRSPRPRWGKVVTLDIADEADREVLHALGRSFELTLELIASDRVVRRCRLTAPLAENVGYLVRAAEEHLQGIAGDASYRTGCEIVLDPGFDLLGAEHPDRPEFRADRLAQIATAQQLRRALAIARHFTWPAQEDYLVCTRGFPLARWHELRRAAVSRAVAWGLWMGPELAQIAVSEGFARSRRALVARLERGFEALRHSPRVFDIDADAAADNAAAIAEQARALGIEVRARPNGAGAIVSDAAPVVSGAIEGTPPHGALPSRSTDDLLALLGEAGAGRGGRAQRLAVALALCDRTDPRVARPVVAAALRMSRGDAVRVLARVVKLGRAAQPALIEGLASSKTYLRHGCALALALVPSDEATQAVGALLLSEPTELWQEIARAMGEIGTPVLDWLARNLDTQAANGERIAWAMAHIGARGSDEALVAMAAGDSIVSPIAVKALELLPAAARDQVRAAPDAADDLGVNRAFSRQFFEALEQPALDEAAAPIAASESLAAVES